MIFVDTSAWFALVDPQEHHHERARTLWAELLTGRLGRPLTTDYILSESYTLLRTRLGFGPAKAFHDQIKASRSIHLIRVSASDFEAAERLMFSHDDKEWSFVDCTSFVVMKELGLDSAFAFDSHFREAGFIALPM